MKILITQDMPLLELYQGHVIPYFSMTERSVIGILDNELVIFPLTCVKIDYSKQVKELQTRLQLTEDIQKMMNETEDDIKTLEI